MSTQKEIVLTPAQAADEETVRQLALQGTGYPGHSAVHIMKRSIDARHRQVRIRLMVQIIPPGTAPPPSSAERIFRRGDGRHRVAIIGAGPAGLFAALRLLEEGFTPVVLERGKDVRSRRRDLAAISRGGDADPDSNYCFGEGGAGTYSDGKLYTRSTKRGDVQSVLRTLVQFGASPDILVDAHPHVGTNKLPGIITAIRECIEKQGGEVHFGARVTDICTTGREVTGVMTESGHLHAARAVILATGHSARDIFQLLADKRWEISFKPFALGVRAEHPQVMIDRIQYHCDRRDENLPPASYSLVHQGAEKSVFSFCMCPGGIIAPCATASGEIVTNGWSPSKRNNPWANSGIVVPVDLADVAAYRDHGALAGVAFQRMVEQACWEAAGGTQAAPAQRMTDFVEGRMSNTLPSCSYQPGIVPVRLDQLLPPFITAALRESFVQFGRKMNGYLTSEAVLVAPESRTSSPVRIPRNQESLMHPDADGLYPCGEGAGYAGGIVSAALDGERCAEAAMARILAH
ncbi:MAG: NAD(P)/FAD-dependent oxidoreductase [Flavobacteriales bacterium]|jgi:uncharacterized FAD-dependent dehydrogenase